MSEYKNILTGAIVQTDCTISGDNWEEVEPKKKESKKKVSRDE